MRDTWASTSITPRASRRADTVGRSSSRRRHEHCSPTPSSCVDLGEHRLKDLGEPERLFQLGAGGFAPLKTLDATNLPLASSSLVGRERELAEVLALLTNGSREVTVTGPGGTGKTRFALQVAAELVGAFRDGVFWVPLAAVADPELVEPEIAQTLGARDSLAGFLHGKEIAAACSTTSSTSSSAAPTRRRASRRGAAGCACSRRAEARSISRASASTHSIRCHRSIRQRSSSSAPARSGATSHPDETDRRDLPHASTGSRSRSSSRPPGRSSSLRRRCWSGSTARSRSSREAPATRRSVRGRCARRSPGATTSSTRSARGSSHACPSSQAGSRSRPPRRSATPSSRPCRRSSTRAC